MKKYKNIIFDLDGTIVNSTKDIVQGVNYATKRLGVPPIDEKTIMSNVGKGLRYLLSQILPEKKLVDEAYKLQNGYYEVKKIEGELYSGVLDFLKTAQKEGINMFIITNKPYKAALHTISELNLINYFKKIYGADSLPKRKPDRMGVDKIIEQYGLERDKTVFIGDSIVDYKTAKNSELDFVFMEYGFELEHIAKTIESDFRFDSGEKLFELI